MIRNTFDKGPEGWCSYDYHWSIVAKGTNIFILTTWQPRGGVKDSGYIWCDETRWSADTPENPVSILAFITYVNWTGGERMDLRDAEVSFYLRGDGLQLHGAKAYFWVLNPGNRWHMTSQPLAISEDRWADQPNRIVLRNDESLWHQSWAGDPPSKPRPLDAVLADVESYGISLVGFGQEPQGKLSLDEFAIRLRAERT